LKLDFLILKDKNKNKGQRKYIFKMEIQEKISFLIERAKYFEIYYRRM